MITVETTDAAVRVTIPKSEVPTDRLKWFVDSLRLEAIARRSHLGEDEAARLADEIKSGWWAVNRHRFRTDQLDKDVAIQANHGRPNISPASSL